MSGASARGLVEGVAHYIRDHQPWEFHLVHNLNEEAPVPEWFADWDGDGIIASIDRPSIAEAIARCHVPTVDVSSNRFIPSIPWIEMDNEKISQLAAEHLIQRGYKHLAFCGDDRFDWSARRRKFFVEHAHKTGFSCSWFELTRGFSDLRTPMEQIGRWLQQLPKPVGLMACSDSLAQKILDVCRFRGLAVPHEVAVIGVDNDSLFCELSSPPLTSVMPNTGASGYQAAALLGKIMRGEAIPPERHVIPPLGVIARQSTDILAVSDPHIQEAVKFIRAQACSGIKVNDVARKAALSRRVLELRFKKLLGRTPREEILQVRLEHVKTMLRETDLPLYRIAEETGFEHIEYLSVVFKRETKVTPSFYRTEAQR